MMPNQPFFFPGRARQIHVKREGMVGWWDGGWEYGNRPASVDVDELVHRRRRMQRPTIEEKEEKEEEKRQCKLEI